MTDAVSRCRTCSVKNIFLATSQNSNENTCVRVSFLIEFQSEARNSTEKVTLAEVFCCEFCEIAKSIFPYRTPLLAASERKTFMSVYLFITWYIYNWSLSWVIWFSLRLKGVLSGHIWDNFWQFKALLKMMKNAFYFTLKALFVLKIFKFLSWLFGHVAKQLD